jgi:hypothetical protein
MVFISQKLQQLQASHQWLAQQVGELATASQALLGLDLNAVASRSDLLDVQLHLADVIETSANRAARLAKDAGPPGPTISFADAETPRTTPRAPYSAAYMASTQPGPARSLFTNMRTPAPAAPAFMTPMSRAEASAARAYPPYTAASSDRWRPPKDDQYPSFDGGPDTDLRRFLRDTDQLRKSYKLPPEELVRKLSLMMTGTATSWYRSKMYEPGMEDADWPTWVEALISEYETADWLTRASAKRDAWIYPFIESDPQTYIFELELLCRSVHPELEMGEFIVQLRRCVPESIVSDINARLARPELQLTTVHAVSKLFIELARRDKQLNIRYSRPAGDLTAQWARVSGKTSSVIASPSPFGYERKPFNASSRDDRKPTSSSTTASPARVASADRIVTAVRSLADQRAPRAPFMGSCYQCGESGHVRARCPKLHATVVGYLETELMDEVTNNDVIEIAHRFDDPPAEPSLGAVLLDSDDEDGDLYA